MKQKIVSLLLAICLVVPCIFALTACGKSAPENTMSMNLNPNVEFVLDGNNKVVSVSYKNGDAGTIYADVNFVGKDVDGVVQIFIEKAAISGHVNLNGSTVKIDVNGVSDKTVKNLQEKAEAKTKEVFANLGVKVSVTLNEVSAAARKEALIISAKALAVDKTETELNNMSEKELVKLINDKQKEYEGLMYDQIQVIEQTVNKAFGALVDAARTVLDEAEKTLDRISETATEARKKAQTLVDNAKKDFDAAVKKFEDKKTELIQEAKEAITEAKNKLVATYKSEVEAFQTKLNSTIESMNLTQAQKDYWNELYNQYK